MAMTKTRPVEITDEEMAVFLGKSVSEIKEIKSGNYDEYKILRIGFLCKKLGLIEEDFEKYIQKTRLSYP